jgi:TATA-box binding protein (TBP) (component of TFIID and TFIIIB)
MCCKFNSTVNLNTYKQNYDYINNNKFYNCVNIKIGVKYQQKQKVCLKVFKNGNIQLCGVENLKSAMYAFRKIFKRLCKISAFEDIPYISDVKICMINSDFKINKCIKQSSLCSIIDSNELDNVSFYSYNPTKYPAINIKLKNLEDKSSCMIFRTGSIIITGGVNFENYLKIYKDLINLFEKNNHILY